ncbi:MAG: four helix bundle protein [Bacteroidetes bacterium]|nr:four helix bundle protein [Bacteroidota bacterium]
MGKSVLKEKSYSFAIRVVKLSQFLQSDKHEFVLSKQVLKSGTSIGALIREAEFAQSNADYINKFSISLKEANESLYWLEILHDTSFIEPKLFESLQIDCKELISMLVSTIKTLKSKK